MLSVRCLPVLAPQRALGMAGQPVRWKLLEMNQTANVGFPPRGPPGTRPAGAGTHRARGSEGSVAALPILFGQLFVSLQVMRKATASYAAARGQLLSEVTLTA